MFDLSIDQTLRTITAAYADVSDAARPQPQGNGEGNGLKVPVPTAALGRPHDLALYGHFSTFARRAFEQSGGTLIACHHGQTAP